MPWQHPQIDVNAAITNAQTSADTAFMLICAALVLLMTPGLAFFSGGFVRSRNILNTLMMSFVLMAIVGVTWILWGYSLAFAPGNPFIGGLEWFGLNGVGLETTNYLKGTNPADMVSYAPTIPHQESKKKPNCKVWISTNTAKKDTTRNSESALVLLIGNAISDC